MILLKILIKILLRVLRRINYISTYTCNTIKKKAAKPPAERSEANKIPSEASLTRFTLARKGLMDFLVWCW